METGGLDYSSMFTPVKTEVMSGIGSAAPIAVAIFGAVLGIGIVIKVFSKLAKRG